MKFAFALALVSAGLAVTGCNELKEAVAKAKKSGTESTEASEKEPAKSGEASVLESAAPNYPVGWTQVMTRKTGGERMRVVVKAGPQTLNGHTVVKDDHREVWQVLGKDKWRLTIQRAWASRSTNLEGAPPERSRTQGALVGKYVILEKTGGVWQGRLESGAKPTADEQALIDDYAVFLSEQWTDVDLTPRRPGETWIEKGGIMGFEDADLHTTFDGIEVLNGFRCAVLSGTIRGSFPMEEDGISGDAVINGSFRIYRSLDQFVNVDVQLRGTMKVTLSPEIGVSVTMEGPLSYHEQNQVTLPVTR